MSSSQWLRRALLANATFSTATAILAWTSGDALASWMGLSTPLWVQGQAPGLLAFALLLVWSATRPKVHAGRALAISIADFTWVAVSAGLLAVPGLLSDGGWWLVADIALVVAGLGSLQVMGIARLLRGDGSRGDYKSVLLRERAISAPPERVWALVSDIAGYAAVAPNLATSRIISGQGAGMVRECTDHTGGRWDETAELWEPGRRFAMRVHTEAADYPNPFSALRGEWEVTPSPTGSVVRMRFDFTLPGGLFAEVMAAVMLAPRFEPVIEAIFDAWQRQAEADDGQRLAG